MRKVAHYRLISQPTSLLKKLLLPLVIFVVLFSNISSSFSASGGKYGAGRIRSCNADGNPEGLTYDPTKSADVEFVMTNPVCLTIILTTYAAVKIAISNMNRTCGTGSSIPRVLPSPMHDAFDITRAGVKAASSQNAACGASVLAVGLPLGVLFTELGVVYAIANDVYKTTSVCGANWKKANPKQHDLSGKGREEEVNLEIQKRLRELESNPNGFDRNKLGLNGLESADKTYREWYYGGVEITDNLPSNSNGSICRDPTRPKGSDGKILYARS